MVKEKYYTSQGESENQLWNMKVLSSFVLHKKKINPKPGRKLDNTVRMVS
jgi:hypothetical protein